MNRNFGKWMSAALAGALLTGVLTGCQSQQKPAADDVTYEAANIARDKTLIKVDGEPVSAEIYCFWLPVSPSPYLPSRNSATFLCFLKNS